MDIAYPNIAERLFGRPHAIEPHAFRAIMDGPLARRILSGDKIDGKAGKRGREMRRKMLHAVSDASIVQSADGIVDYAVTPDGVAIIPVAGVLSRRFDWLAAACGWSTYEGLGATLEAVIEDYRTSAILFDVDSPGGEADGMLDFADAILTAAQSGVPVWAVANTLAASAAYAIAGSATRLFLPRIAEVGSIGCVMVHIDQSNQDMAQGLNYTAVYSGAHKIDGWGHAPLSDEALASAQAGVDHVRDQFADLVGRQGRISKSAALKTEAAVFADMAAVEAGLADDVGTFDDALGTLILTIKNRSLSPLKGAHMKKPPSRAAASSVVIDQAAASEIGDASLERPAAVAADAAESVALVPGAAAVAPGEKCIHCGKVMPDDPADNDGNPPTAASAPASAEAAAAAASAEYGHADVMATMDLCRLAGMESKSREFIATKTPVDKVREALIADKAKAADALHVSRGVTTGNGDSTQSPDAINADWQKVHAMSRSRRGRGSKE